MFGHPSLYPQVHPLCQMTDRPDQDVLPASFHAEAGYRKPSVFRAKGKAAQLPLQASRVGVTGLGHQRAYTSNFSTW